MCVFVCSWASLLQLGGGGCFVFNSLVKILLLHLAEGRRRRGHRDVLLEVSSFKMTRLASRMWLEMSPELLIMMDHISLTLTVELTVSGERMVEGSDLDLRCGSFHIQDLIYPGLHMGDVAQW